MQSNNPHVVIKFGGNALTAETAQAFCREVAKLPTLGYSPIIVHGGGPQIDSMLQSLHIESRFIGGLRFTDSDTLAVVEMVLSGQVGKMLVQYLNQAGAPAVSISGKDGKTLLAEKLRQDQNGNPIDLGFVGSITQVNPDLLTTLSKRGFVPIVAPLACAQDGQTYNINADYAAAAIAKAVAAQHFIVMTNTAGLLDAKQQLISSATADDIHALIDNKTIIGGMIPKTLSAIETLSTVGEVNIIDGRQPSNLTAVLSDHRIGTTIYSR